VIVHQNHWQTHFKVWEMKGLGVPSHFRAFVYKAPPRRMIELRRFKVNSQAVFSLCSLMAHSLSLSLCLNENLHQAIFPLIVSELHR
jgi:hypothetical protein